METVDGKLEKIKELHYFDADKLNEENLISEEDRQKYEKTPPSAEELGTLLKDFVIYHKPLHRVDTGTATTSINTLVNSFNEGGKFGKFIVEEVEQFSLPDQKLVKYVIYHFTYLKICIYITTKFSVLCQKFV